MASILTAIRMNAFPRHLHFTQSIEPLLGAGLGSAALGLHCGMISIGIISKLVTTGEPNASDLKRDVTQFPRRGPDRAFYAPEMWNQAAKLVSDADVIHGHGFYVGPNWCLGRQARQLGKPMVYHVHGFLDPWITKRSRWKKWISHLLFENANFKSTRLWRALSKKEEQQIRDFGIQAPIVVLPNGVELPQDRETTDIEKLIIQFPKVRPKRLLFMARIHPKKGLDLLINSWASLPSQITKDWEIAIFGPDEGGHADQVSQWIEKANLQTSVRLMGTVSGEAKEAAFRSADLFVLPSYSEGFPMAVLEASSYGLPVVMTDECNFPELAQAGGAWECRPEVTSLGNALLEGLSCDDMERHQRGELGRRLVAAGYTWESVAQQLSQACEEYL